MSGEEAEESVAVGLPPDLVEWLDGQAGGREPDEFLRDLVGAFRSVSETEGGLAGVPDLEARLDSQREEYVDLLEDVRERVIQVKREADAKAPADHDHPELRSTVEGTGERVDGLEDGMDEVRTDLDALESDLADLEESVDGLRADLDSGFDNYEDVLRYLTDLAEGTDEHLTVLARAVVEMRETTREVLAAERARERADRLKLAANRDGITSADCDECDGSVAVGLLGRPECPHCGRAFVDVEPKSGLFGSATLVTGSAPALDGEVGVDTGDLDDVVEAGDAPSVDLTGEDETE